MRRTLSSLTSHTADGYGKPPAEKTSPTSTNPSYLSEYDDSDSDSDSDGDGGMDVYGDPVWNDEQEMCVVFRDFVHLI